MALILQIPKTTKWAFFFFLLTFISVHVGSAQTLRTFTGTGNWDVVANWDGTDPNRVANTLGEIAVIDNADHATLPTGYSTSIGRTSGTGNGNALVLDNGAQLTIASGASLTLGSQTLFNSGIFNNLDTQNNPIINVHGTLYIFGDLIVNNNITLNITGTMRVFGNIIVNNNAALTVTNSGTLIVGGNVSVGNGSALLVNGNVNIGGSLSAGNNSSLSGTGTMIVGNGCSGPINTVPPFCQSGPLPVVLLTFQLSESKEGVVVSWSTATEKNADLFIVERSLNGKDFSEIANVRAVGNSILQQHYTFTDASPLVGRGYYRLKQVDINGSAEYFHIRFIDLAGKKKLSVFPNPLESEELNVHLNFSTDETVFAKIYNSSGTLVQSFSFSGNDFNLPVRLSPGTYLVKVNSGTVQLLTRITVR